MTTDKNHALELSIEFVVELLLFLFPYGADQMGLPHSFLLGFLCWIVGAAIGLRMFWIFPLWTDRLTWAQKSLICILLLLLFVGIVYKPVLAAYRKQSVEQEAATPKETQQQPQQNPAPPQQASPSSIELSRDER